jgi:hypothetical protein
MAKEMIQFVKVDVASLPEECQVLWAELLAAKVAFKASLQPLAPDGKRVQFVEKYGELKIALSTVAKAKVGTASLADFLAGQEAGGFAS